jgi:TolB-like protein/Flp pilus assembly protein TadD
MDNEDNHPTPEAVRDELSRILTAPDFDASERNRSFLRYVVEETLEGRGNRIKAYTIATTVFKRDPSFDPQLDSIVRIEAGRLRRSLEHYYLTTGVKDLIRITLPRGSYMPGFEFAGLEGGMPPHPSDLRRTNSAATCTILMLPFDEDGKPASLSNFSRGVTRQIIVALTCFTDLCILGTDALPGHEGDTIASESLERLSVDFLLKGGVTLTAESFALEVMLMDARTGRYVWAEHFHRKLIASDILDLRDEVADSIASTLAQPYGIIFCNKARDAAARAPEFLNLHDGVRRYYKYHRTLDGTVFPGLLTDLERVIQMDPLYADAFACLSQMYSDAYRFRRALPEPGIDPRQRALLLARGAIELAPNSSHGHHALGHAYWFNGDLCSALAAFEAGRALNPNDTDLMADLGFRFANLGRWQEALPLLEKAFARNPAQPGIYRAGLAQYHYVHGHYEQALAEARKMNTPTVVDGFVLIAAAAGQLGLRRDANDALQRVVELDPHYGDRIVTDLVERHIHLDTISALLDGLRKAGLTGREMGACQRAVRQ